ncbi:hypothetical protein [Virgibacillus sp. 7505]|uniref:hypothetical protein n=1 Tax=Virgibacillus sp. 7505 TaxID=2022548 RepID=UPI001595CEFC|nr:hypothetical protein [Virgibacillus sp. 7505]
MDRSNDPLMLSKNTRVAAFIEILKTKKGEPTVVLIDGVEFVKKPAGQKGRK